MKALFFFCSAVFLFAALSGSPLATAQQATPPATQGFKVREECLKAARNGIETDASAAQYNFHCDHEWALRNGNSINYVNQLYIQEKYRAVRDAAKFSKTVADFYKDGTCLKGVRDPNTNMVLDETLADCEKRLHRAVLDAQVQNREKTLQYNKARGELLDERGVDLQNTNEVRSQQNIPKTSILNDLYNFSKTGPDGKPITAPESQDGVTETKEASKESIAGGVKLESADRQAVGQDAQTKMGLSGSSLEVGTTKVNETLDGKLQKLVQKKDGNFSKGAYDSDLKKQQAVERQMIMTPPGKGPDLSHEATESSKAFNKVMDSLNGEAKKDKDLPSGLEQAADKQVSASPKISTDPDAKPGDTSGKGTLDKSISDLIDPQISE